MQRPYAFVARRANQRLAQLSRASSTTVRTLTCASASASASSNVAASWRALGRAMAFVNRRATTASAPAAAALTPLTAQLQNLRMPHLSGVSTATATTLSALPVRRSFFSGASMTSLAAVSTGSCLMAPSLFTPQRAYHHGMCRATRASLSPKKAEGGQLQGVNNLERYKGDEEEEQKGGGGDQDEDPFNKNSGPGYLPFPPPFHTINIVMILFLANVLCYCIMNFGNDDWRDFIVEHFTLSHENWTRIYPLFTNAFYQENLLQLLIDCWLLWQFGDTMLGFLGNTRMAFFAMLCTLGGSMIHVARQQFELYYGMDDLEVRGRCYGPNPFIMGLVAIEGLIFRHLNFIQQPPIPFLVLTAFVMVIDVWRIFTTKPEEHGAATGGALMAYLFWALPTRMLGLDKLTATM